MCNLAENKKLIMPHVIQLDTTISFRVPFITTACLGKLYFTTILLIKILVDVNKYNEVNEGLIIRGKHRM